MSVLSKGFERMAASNMVRTPTCGRCSQPMHGYAPTRRWHNECETPRERHRRETKLAQRRKREQVPENSMAGRTLTCGCGKCGKTFVTKPGRQRVFAVDCPHRHVDRMRAQRLTHAPIAEGKKFNRFSKVPETPCGCGGGCGLTFRRVLGQRGRLFAKGCPVQRERVRQNIEYARRKFAEKKAREQLEGGPRKRGGQHGGPGIARPKMCHTCYNLPHNRPSEGCPDCGLPCVPMTKKEKEFVRSVRGNLIVAKFDKKIDREPR